MGSRSNRPRQLGALLLLEVDAGMSSVIASEPGPISQAHLVGGYASPRSDRLVKETWKGIRRRVGVAKAKKDPLSAPDLRRMVDALPSGLIGLRDRALILLGFAGGFRRSELVALNLRRPHVRVRRP